MVRVPGIIRAEFTLFNTHSLPLAFSVRGVDEPNLGGLTGIASARVDIPGPQTRTLNTATDTFSVTYVQESGLIAPGIVPPKILERPVLKNAIPDRAVGPLHPLRHPWDAPFLYEDSRHVFYVTSTQRRITFRRFDGYVPTTILETPPLQLPRLVQPPLPVVGQPLTDVGLDSSGSRFGGVDPAPIRDFVSRHPNIKRVIATGGTFRFGAKDIGPEGALPTGTRRS